LTACGSGRRSEEHEEKLSSNFEGKKRKARKPPVCGSRKPAAHDAAHEIAVLNLHKVSTTTKLLLPAEK
jgi:hypothetical protein